VVRALVTNALEHGGSDPAVTVTGERVADGVAVRVSDDGPGIPVYELDVLDSGAESALEHGSGLGLWIADWGARTLGGDLSFETGEDGTTATVTLPAAGREA
jgi:signal transduction histidine kinase